MTIGMSWTKSMITPVNAGLSAISGFRNCIKTLNLVAPSRNSTIRLRLIAGIYTSWPAD